MSTLAMTLIEHSKNASPLTQAVTDIYAQSSDILMALPFKNVVGGAYKYSIEDAGGGIAFRGINESYTPSTGVENPQVETLSIAGGDADVDMFLLATQGEGRRAREENKKIKSLSRGITDAILAGDSSTDPREFDGLQRRLTGDQVLANSAAAGGAALSLAALDDLIERVTEPTHLIMNKRFRDVHFKGLLRNQTLQGNVDIQKDDLGRPVVLYNGLPFLIGYETGPEARILPFTEVGSGGGGAVTSSIYCVSMKDGHMCGIQDSAIATRDLGELETKPAKRTRIEWYPGIVIENPYSASRLTSITDASIVA